MAEYNIYKDIAERTDGDVYLGVVGPVRTGKSTFIKNFMNLFVLPNIENENDLARARDELPQSADGKTIMTTEPKFIPDEAVRIFVDGRTAMKVRFIDCVGYVVPSAIGHTEEDSPRMVATPWSDTPMPFFEAAEIGTKKVICDHSTIGMLITTDGSIGDIPREDYIDAEARVARELHEIGKPFVIVLNTKYPTMPETEQLRQYLQDTYQAPVVCVNCLNLSPEDIQQIMHEVLLAFPVKEIRFSLPDWTQLLPDDHPTKQSLCDAILKETEHITNIYALESVLPKFSNYETIADATIKNIDLGTGTVTVSFSLPDTLFYKVVHEDTGFDVSDTKTMFGLLKELSQMKTEYDKIKCALTEVEQKGYGIVTPGIDEMHLEEPRIVRQGNRFGVKLKASAPSIHMIRADIETEVSPIVGTEKQSEELVHYLLKEFENDPKEIWRSNIFGKSLHELVNEGLNNKLAHMPDEAQLKLQETLEKIINEGSGGLICIIL